MNAKKLKFIAAITFIVLILVVTSPTAFGMPWAADVGRSPQGQDPVSPAATVRWQSAVSGNWSDGSKWSTGYAPGAGDDVIIDIAGYYTVIVDTSVAVKSLTLGGASGGTQTLSIGSSRTLTLNGDSTVGASGVMALSGGTLDGAGSLTVDGAFDWSGGTVQSTGVFTVNSTLDFSGTSGKFMDGCTITNKGTANVTGTGIVYFQNGASFDNQAGATFDFQTDADLNYSGGAATTFNNAGTLTKSGGAGTSTIGLVFNNTGQVNVSSGILELKGGGAYTGDFAIASGCTLQFCGGTHSLDGVDFTGSGTVKVTAGEVDTTGSGATVSNATTMALSGGYPAPIFGGDGPLTLNGPSEWGHVTIQGTGALTNNATMTISGADAKIMDTRTITNKGTANVTGTGIVYFQNGASFDNQAGATFDFQTDADLNYSGGAATTFNNAGTLTKSGGAGTSTIGLVFNNTGQVNVSSGILELKGGGAYTGDFAIASGCTLQFCGGTHSLDGVDFTGSGTVKVTAGEVDTTGSGATVSNATTMALSGGYPAPIFGGDGPLTLNGPSEWGHVTIQGTGALTNNATMTISGADAKIMDTRTITNKGTANVTGTGIVYFQNGASFDNQAGATFDFQTDADLNHSGGAATTFNNAGTLTKSAGTGTATIDMDFTNSGGVDVNTGSLIFGKNLTNNSGGVVAVASGASMSVNGTLTNNGELRQTQDVNGSSDTAFFDTGGYGGAILNANGADLGSTTVTIKGNQDCTTSSGDTIKRCFDIAPTNATGRNAIITFYFADSEIPAGQSCASMDGYHWNGTGWEKLTLDDSYGTSGRDCSSVPRSLRVKNVAAFSPFVLKAGAPTAVTLRSFVASPTTDVPWGLLLFSLSAAVLVAVWRK